MAEEHSTNTQSATHADPNPNTYFNAHQNLNPNPQQNQNTYSVPDPNDPAHPHSPYYIGGSDSSGTILVTHVLDSTNYYAWARSMKRALRIKNKLGFIDGSLTEPDPSSFLIEHWLRCNDLVIAWLQNTMSMEVKSCTLYVESARELWLDLEHRLAQQNAPRVYEVKQAISSLMQNQDDVSVYFSKYKTLLDELMNYESIPNCTCGGLRTVVDNQQRDWVMRFLMGLNESYKDIKAQILLIKPLPGLNEVYSTIQQEEKRRQISMDSPPSDSMAMMARGFRNRTQHTTNRNAKYFCTRCKIADHSLERCLIANSNTPVCSHCNFPGHSIDKCFKIHGYPQ